MRAVEFMTSVSPELRREFIAGMPVFFNKLESGYNFGIAPPPEYINFVACQCASEDTSIANAAQRAARFLSQDRKPNRRR